MENPSYFAVIPANVRYDKDLKPMAKLLFGEIAALCDKKGYCYAKNNYFAELYGMSKEAISRLISSLAKKGYITIEIIYKDGTKEIEDRYIRICDEPIDQKINTYCQKNQEGIDQKINTPIDQKVKGNNTSNNNININEKENIKRKSFPPTLEEIESYIKEKQLNVSAKDFLEYFEATNWIDSNGNKVKSWKGKLLTWNSYRKKETNTQTKITSNPFVEIMMEGRNDKGEYG